MDIASLIGLLGALALMIFGMVSGKEGFAAIKSFLDPPSALITFGGALFTMLMAQDDIKAFVDGLKSITLIFKPMQADEANIIKTIIDLSNIARKDGLLALEEAAGGLEDAFLKKGVLLVVDGTDPELVRSILETELICIEDRHKGKIGFWDSLGAAGPAWGMIGTLIGLINMLKNLSDPNSIGPQMAVALVTTFYGSLLANWICTPVANKLKSHNAYEIKMKEVLVEGLLSIQAGENPRVIEEKLKSFLAPKDREALNTNEGGEE
ncbi:MAG: motility protein A [Lachnospiraceae bacterium]|nr:motility protein A [Lachnospiraceae bacterium]